MANVKVDTSSMGMTVDDAAMAIGGLLFLVGCVVDPHLVGLALVVWGIDALYEIAT